MHVLLIPGGLPVDYTAQLGKALARRVSVGILVPATLSGTDSEASLRTVSEGVRLFTAPLPRSMPGLVGTFAGITILLRQLRSFKPDVIHVQDVDLTSLLISLAMPRTKVAITLHDVELVAPFRSPFYRLLRWWFLSRARAVFVHGPRMKEVLVRTSRVPASLVHDIPMGVHNVESMRRYLAEPVEERMSILVFGWIAPRKGIEVLIQAAPSIVSQVPGVRIVIAGRVGSRSYYKQLLKATRGVECVQVLPGYVDASQAARLFRSCALVALPYATASQSGVIPVAYFFKKAVVATDVGSLAEQVENNVTGVVTPPRDSKALALAIVRLLKNKELRGRLGENGFRKICTDWSWDIISASTCDAYNEMLGVDHPSRSQDPH